jgi:hypothetical protein
LAQPSLTDIANKGHVDVAATDSGVEVAITGDQSPLWNTAQTTPDDLPFGDVNGDGIPDIFYESAVESQRSLLQMAVPERRCGRYPDSTPI